MAVQEPNIYIFYDIKKDGVILRKDEKLRYFKIVERYRINAKILDFACYNIYLRALNECFDLDTAGVLVQRSVKIISDGYAIFKFRRYVSRCDDVMKDFMSIFLANLDDLTEKMNNIISETDEFQLECSKGVIYTIKFHIATTDKLWGVMEIKEPSS